MNPLVMFSPDYRVAFVTPPQQCKCGAMTAILENRDGRMLCSECARKSEEAKRGKH